MHVYWGCENQKFFFERRKRTHCFLHDLTVIFISIRHKGISDIETHIIAKSTKLNLRPWILIEKSLTVFHRRLQEVNKRSAAEDTLAFRTVKHHQSYYPTECTGRLMKVIFPDSNIANEMTCSRTKTEPIINSVISPWVVKNLTISLKNIN